MHPEATSIAEAIVRAAREGPDRPALTVDGECWTYQGLIATALQLAAALPRPLETGPQPITAVMAQRHASSYVGILAALLGGHAYVPINVEHPDERNLRVLRGSGAARVICGEQTADRLASMLDGEPELTERLDVIRLADGTPASMPAVDRAPPVARPTDDALAYVLFTSGSTGEPKGVPISHGNLTSYLDAVGRIMDVGPEDRCSQTFELTFDLSVHDLLVSWTNGAHLIVPDENDLADPARYIRGSEISCWFSVPSLAQQIRLRGHLGEDTLPSLRWSLFCGEALPADLATAWAAAAPSSRVENWYGPTEGTIACARFALPRDANSWEARNGLVPIGTPFPGMEMTVSGDDLRSVAPGTAGELLLSGPQVASGYVGGTGNDVRAFVTVPGREGIVYRTGDRVVQGSDGTMHFLGRADHQVKIRGHRVELGAVEAEIRSVVDRCAAVALSWPPDEVPGTSVVAALETQAIDVQTVIDRLRATLPEYMVPSSIVCMQAFPRNASGKVDRAAIAAHLHATLGRDAHREEVKHLPPRPARLMRSILDISPNLSAAQIMRADSLLAAGMDSLSFVSLTAEIERVYGLNLEQEDVVALAEMPFGDLVEAVTGGDTQRSRQPAVRRMMQLPASISERLLPGRRSRGRPGGRRNGAAEPRAQRVAQFIERFPEVLAAPGAPLVLAVGSSGTFRSFAPGTFDEAAASAGWDVRALNLGFAALSGQSVTRVCRFVRERCEAVGARVPVVIYELDPMHISVLRAKTAVEIGPEFFSGQVVPAPVHSMDDEFTWQPGSDGAVEFNVAAMSGRRRPLWETKRDFEIARTFLGDVPFDRSQIEAWVDGARMLSAVADRVVGFVHPLEPKVIESVVDRWHGPRLGAITSEVEERSGVRLIPWQGFELDASDFLDINHVNPWSGRHKLTAQLAERCLDVLEGAVGT